MKIAYRLVCLIAITIICQTSVRAINIKMVGNAHAVIVAMDHITKKENRELNTMKILPNPASEYFAITNSSEIETITIYNTQGKEKMRLKGGKRIYNVSVLPKGLYIVRLVSKDGRVKMKRLLRG